MIFGPFRTGVMRNGLVEVVARGEVTGESFLASAALHWAALGGMAARGRFTALILDLRKAYEANGGRAIGRCATPHAPRFMREVPTAIIVSPHLLQKARDYGASCAAMGAVIGAFTSRSDAEQWAMARGQALLAQRVRCRTK